MDEYPEFLSTVTSIFKDICELTKNATELLNSAKTANTILDLVNIGDSLDVQLDSLRVPVEEYKTQHTDFIENLEELEDEDEKEALKQSYNALFVHDDTSKPYIASKLAYHVAHFIGKAKSEYRVLRKKLERQNEQEEEVKSERASQGKGESVHGDRENDSVFGNNSEHSSVRSHNQRRNHLPQLRPLKVPEFSGERTEWIGFWALFKHLVDERDDLEPFEKFSYLISSLSGKALKMVQPVAALPDCYSIALETLREYYDDSSFTKHHLSSSFRKCRAKSNSLDDLIVLTQEMRTLLTQMKQFGDEDQNALLSDLIFSKFPSEWQLKVMRVQTERGITTNSGLLTLFKEMLVAESILRDRIVSIESTSARTQHTSSNFSSNNSPSATHCAYCGKHSGSENCRTVTNTDQRWTIVKEKKLCIKCLGKHLSTDCRARCSRCEGSHHISLCKGTRSTFSQGEHSQKRVPYTPQGNIPHKTFAPHGTRPPNSNNENRGTKPPPSFNARTHHVVEEQVSRDKPTGSSTESVGSTMAVVPQIEETPRFNVVRLLTAHATLINPETQASVRADILIDPGSSVTLISRNLASLLQLRPHSKTHMTVSTLGANRTPQRVHDVHTINLPTDNGIISVNCTEYPDPLLFPLKNGRLSEADIQEIQKLGIHLSDDPTRDSNIKPEMLIGLPDFLKIRKSGELVRLPSGLSLLPTSLGYVITGVGPQSSKEEGQIFFPQVNSICSELDLDIEKYFGVEMVLQPNETLREEKERIYKEVEEHFRKTVRFDGGKYVVEYCMKPEVSQLPTNYQIAYRRLISTVKSLSNNESLLSYYDDLIKNQISAGQVEDVPQLEKYDTEGCHYLPHQGVLRINSETTPLRIVFDASAKSKNGASLNEMMLPTPNTLEEIPAILLRARTGPFLLTSDVEKAFLQVRVEKKQRNLLRFLWLKDIKKPVEPRNIRTLRFLVTPFGISQSPFTLLSVVSHHLHHLASETQDESTRRILEQIHRNSYVDNVLIPSESLSETHFTVAKEAFASMEMNLRDFVSNDPAFNERVPEPDRGKSGDQKLLGIQWNTDSDMITFFPHTNPEAYTKRQVLSSTASIYDPQGLLTPITVTHSLFTQSLWKNNLKWDEKMTEEQREEWKEICRQNDIMIHIPRYTPIGERIQIALFSDASVKALGAVAYSCVSPHTSVIMSRTRLAHLHQKSTVPRLELEGILLGYKLLSYIVSALSKEHKDREIEIFVYSDSSTVLYWLDNQKDQGTVISRRVKEIRSIIDKVKQNPLITVHPPRYVPTKDNPADLLTRGVTPSELQNENSLWWRGPPWLKLPSTKWPSNKFPDSFDPNNIPVTEPTPVLTNVVEQQTPSVIDFSRFSDLSKLVRTVARILRWKEKAISRNSAITSSEYTSAYRKVIQIAQRSISKDHDLVRNKALQMDEKGIWRGSHGRIDNSSLPFETKFPIYLPHSEKHLITLIIREIHLRSHHAGFNATLNGIKRRYWIPKLQSLVKSTLHRCVPCRKSNNPPFPYQSLPPLPKERIEMSRPFEYTGVDYFGPFTSGDTKRFGLIFTCLSTRLIHLDVTHSVSTEEFLLALRRFCARKGAPSYILSDRAPTFLLADKIINKDLLDERVTELLTSKGTIWKFTTSYSPWQGGVYESLLKSVKRGLQKTIGRRNLSDSEFYTVLTEVEATMNSRPLTIVPSDTENEFGGTTIRPIDFVLPHSDLMLPFQLEQPDEVYTPPAEFRTTSRTVERYMQKMNDRIQKFWDTFANEYLIALRDRNKAADSLKENNRTVSSQYSPKKGDIVLLMEENIPRCSWKMGKIISIEGHTVTLKSQAGNRIERPQNLLIPLEISAEPEPDEPAKVIKSRFEPILTRSRAKAAAGRKEPHQ